MKTPPYKNNPLITEAAFKSMVINSLRMRSRFWTPAMEAKKAAFIGYIVSKKGQKVKGYQCASCKGKFQGDAVAIDHINPVIDPRIGWQSWDIFIEKLFGSVLDYQILCISCHQIKTEDEREIKKQFRPISNATCAVDIGADSGGVRTASRKPIGRENKKDAKGGKANVLSTTQRKHKS